MKFLKHGTFLFLFLSLSLSLSLMHSANALGTGNHEDPPQDSLKSPASPSSNKLNATPEIPSERSDSPSPVIGYAANTHITEDFLKQCHQKADTITGKAKGWCSWAWEKSGAKWLYEKTGAQSVCEWAYKKTGTHGEFYTNWFKNNPNMVIHALTDALTIGAINSGSFANPYGCALELVIFLPRWIYGFAFLRECDEQIEKAKQMTTPSASEIQDLMTIKGFSGRIHLSSDLADVMIRALRDGGNIITPGPLKATVTLITFFTQILDFILAAGGEYLKLTDAAPHKKKRK